MCNDLTNVKVAIVVPAFNVASYINDCLKSIVNQTYKNYSVFVVDDGSTDGTEKIVDQYQGDGRFIIIHQINMGLGGARNSAMKEIFKRGGYSHVVFIDSDDRVYPNFIEELLRTSIRERAEIVVCAFRRFNEYGVVNDGFCLGSIGEVDKDCFVNLVFSCGNWKDICGAGGMVWKNIFTINVLHELKFIEARDSVEDELFCLQAALRANKIYYIPEKLYEYRQRDGSAVHSDGIKEKLLKSRQMCLPVAKEISYKSQLVVASKLIRGIVGAAKRNNLKELKIAQYKTIFSDAHKMGLVDNKVYYQYLLLCQYPLVWDKYLLVRKLFRYFLCK